MRGLMLESDWLPLHWQLSEERFGGQAREAAARLRNPAESCHQRWGSPMPTMDISLPDSLTTCVDEQVAGRGYGTSSEHMRELIRKDQDRERLRALLLEGAESEPAGVADAAYFERLRARS